MNKEKLGRANDIIQTQERLQTIRHILPQKPWFVRRNKNTCLRGDYTSVSLYELDEVTRDELCEAIRNYIDKRVKELDEELKNL